MKHVQRWTSPDGKERLYFRKAGAPRVALKAAWGTPELAAEVAAILAATAPDPAPQTLRAVLRAYELKSADFAGLADSTKYEYRLILKELEADFGALAVATFKPAYLLQLRNAWAPRGHRAANLRLQVLKNALWPEIVAGKLGDGDPFALIPQVRRPRDLPEPHILWPESVVQRVIQECLATGKPGLARGVAIGRYAGPRRNDIVKLTRATRRSGHRPGQNTGRFAFLATKKHIPVDQPEDPALAAVLDGTPGHEPGGPMILAYNLEGLAYTPNGFAQELGKVVDDLFKRGEIDSDRYNVHGLRHTFGVEAALAGCTDAQGGALMGHASPNSFATYRRQADRIRLADDAATKIAQLRERTGNDQVSNHLSKLCQNVVVPLAKSRGKRRRKSTT